MLVSFLQEISVIVDVANTNMDLSQARNTTATSLTPLRYHEILSNLGWNDALLLLAIALVTRVVYNAFLHPLRKVPGPFLAGVTELWRTTKYARGQWHQDIIDLHRQYGPVVRVSPNEVSFVDQTALEQLYGHSTGTKKVYGARAGLQNARQD